MGAAASAISQQDLTNEEKIIITKVRIISERGVIQLLYMIVLPRMSIWRFDYRLFQVLQDKYHAMRLDAATKDAPEIEVFGALST